MTGDLDVVFSPRRIALVGASDQPGKLGRLLWDNLTTFPGDVVPVTTSARSVAGVAAVASLRDVPGPVDLAVIAVPAPAVPKVVGDAAASGIPAVVVLTGGFAEVGTQGQRLQEQLVAAAGAGGVRVIGPNSLGVQNCDLPLNASMAAGVPPGGGGISLVTQSGAYGMAMHTLGMEEQARFAKVCAVGNQVDVTSAELLEHLADDPATTVACFFLESLPDGRAFYEAARRATPRMPVVVARTGRSSAGARAARSHTAALAGNAAVEQGALAQAGVLQTRSGLEMMDVARALARQPAPRGRRVGIVTNSGGTGVELADLLADEGMQVPALSATLQAKLARLLPAHGSPANPVDVTPAWPRFAMMYPKAVDLLARSGEVDVVVPVLLQRAAADETVAIGIRDTVAGLHDDGHAVPVHVCWVAPRAARGNADLLQDAGVSCFEWPERTARAVAHAVRHGERAHAAHPTGAAPKPATLAETLRAAASGPLPTDRGRCLLEAAGIDAVTSHACSSPEEAVQAASQLGFPVVVKLSHPSVLHRSDVGGVRTALRDDNQVLAATRELLASWPDGQVLVQPQLSGVELVVGGLRDPQFGPAVMVGVGGILVEAIRDVAFGLAPLTLDEARALWGGLRGRPVLEGARGGAAADLDALADVTARVGDLLVAEPRLAEVDLNPLIACGDRVTAVDWRLLVGHPA